MRSSPPAVAGADEERKLVFQSALAQAEELWEAASVVGPASRPLPLFYCMSQAGRAVCAASAVPGEWRPLKHGLRRHVSEAATPDERVVQHATSVVDDPVGSFGMIARATESETFEGRASVGDLWASLQGFPTPGDLFGERPRRLILNSVPAPEDDRPMFARVGSPLYGTFSFGVTDVLPDGYPRLQGMQFHGLRDGAIFREQAYSFPREDGTLRPLWEVGERDWERADRPLGKFVVRPGVGDGRGSLPSEFLTLYALLFCLSELARYYPDTWVGALDPDMTPAAVTLEHGLDIALERAPKLISEALGGPISRFIREAVARAERELREEEEAREAEGDPAP